MRKKLITIHLFALIIICNFNICFASDDLASVIDESEIIEEQSSMFGLDTFITESKYYVGDFFDDLDLNELLSGLISGEIDNLELSQKILYILGQEVLVGLEQISLILAIIVIHSILKSLTDSLESNNISKLIYYTQYILIVTIIASSFIDIAELVEATTSNLVGFMNLLIPLLMTLMIYSGSIVSSRTNTTYFTIFNKFYWK